MQIYRIGYYRTRDNRVAYVNSIKSSGYLKVGGILDGVYSCWEIDGRTFPDQEFDCDLISYIGLFNKKENIWDKYIGVNNFEDPQDKTEGFLYVSKDCAESCVSIEESQKDINIALRDWLIKNYPL